MVYALPIALSLGQRGNAGRSSGTSSSKKRVSITIATRWTSLQRAAKQLLSADALIFGLVSVTVVSGLGLVLFRLYGWEFFQVRASQRRFPLPQVRDARAADTHSVRQLGCQGEDLALTVNWSQSSDSEPGWSSCVKIDGNSHVALAVGFGNWLCGEQRHCGVATGGVPLSRGAEGSPAQLFATVLPHLSLRAAPRRNLLVAQVAQVLHLELHLSELEAHRRQPSCLVLKNAHTAAGIAASCLILGFVDRCELPMHTGSGCSGACRPTQTVPAVRRVVSGSQLLAVASLGWQHAAHLPSAFLLQTLAFVALNKVG